MTKFRDMTPCDRRGWLSWARSHDWGQNALMTEDGQITGLVDRCTARCERTGAVRLIEQPGPAFDAPRPLRDWAGY